MRLRNIVLLTGSKFENDDPLTPDTGYKEQVLNYVRVTELNGAQAQNNAIGKQFNHTYVIRLQGDYQADKVAFLEDYQIDKDNTLEISQVRHHHFKTDIYCGDTKVNS